MTICPEWLLLIENRYLQKEGARKSSHPHGFRLTILPGAKKFFRETC